MDRSHHNNGEWHYFLFQPKWTMKNPTLFFITVTIMISSVFAEDYFGAEEGDLIYEAIVNISFKNPGDGFTSKIFHGKFGNRFSTEKHMLLHGHEITGKVVCVRSKDNETHGCSEYNIELPSEKWIALIKRGKCPFTEKIKRATKHYNASAVVIFNNISENLNFIIEEEKDTDSISVSLLKVDGDKIVDLLELGITVHMTITVGKKYRNSLMANQSNISKTSVLFVSISFIVLMIISLAWLVFYYIQRFRYAHAKERLARRLASAAKKAIAKIPQRNIKSGDKELDGDFDQCAVCIEWYKAHDVIRTLPCKHVFHKSCVDPWLLDQRSCPMCKLDILRAYGMQVGGSEDLVHPDGESAAASVPAEEVEQMSITEEHGEVEGQVKVLLLPHNCIHFHHREIGDLGESSVDSQTEDELGTADHVSDAELESRSLMDSIVDSSDRSSRNAESTA